MREPYLVVGQGDNLWNLTKRAYLLTSDTPIANQLKRVVAANPHIKNPNRILPGQVVKLPPTAGPSPFASEQDLLKAQAELMQMPSTQRDFLINHFDEILLLEQELSHPTFLRDASLQPGVLVRQVQPGGIFEITRDTVFPWVRKGYKYTSLTAKSIYNVGSGTWGSFGNPHIWRSVASKYVTALGNRVRYLKGADGIPQLIPKGARMLRMGDKIIITQPSLEGFEQFSAQVARGKDLAQKAKPFTKGGTVIGTGFAVANVALNWDSPDRNKIATKETAKLVAGHVLKPALTTAAHSVCLALDFTTGPGGIVCHVAVFVGSNIAVGMVIDEAVDLVFEYSEVLFP